MPSWSAEQLATGFAAIRDARWLTLPAQPDFERRIPWLAVQTGCEERALAALYLLQQRAYPTPYLARASKKDTLFQIKTDNEPSGEVSWGAHVAPVVQVAGELIVLDPALHPSGPLALQTWLSLFTENDNADVGICRDREAGDGCFDATARVLEDPVDPDRPEFGIIPLLEAEWRVQQMLGRDPMLSLGECPPWLDCPILEPAADPNRAPTLQDFLSDQAYDHYISAPLYVVGDNFMPGVTSVRITGNGIDELATLSACNKRRIEIDTDYAPGTYQVTAANGGLVSQPATLVVPGF